MNSRTREVRGWIREDVRSRAYGEALFHDAVQESQMLMEKDIHPRGAARVSVLRALDREKRNPY